MEEIGNVHTLRDDNRILRGASPEGKGQVLKQNGITDVLIFRDGVGDSIRREKKELRELGYRSEQIRHIEMKWRNITDVVKSCQDVVMGLQLMKNVEDDPSRKLYLHCTMGEDRTGMISGLYRMIFQNWSSVKAYQEEMCTHGFADSNPRKPDDVANAINEALKTLFIRMAVLVETQKLTKDHLDPKACLSITDISENTELMNQKCLN